MHIPSLCDQLEKFSKSNSTKVAMLTTDKSITYSQLWKKINDLAGHFNLLIKKNETVAIQLPNCFELVYSYFACFKIGVIIVPLSIKLKWDEIQYLLDQTQPSYFISHSHVSDEWKNIEWKNTSIKQMILIDKPQNKLNHPFLLFEDLLKENLIASPKSLSASNQVAAIFFTSGSTGKPKGVEHTHDSLAAMANNIAYCVDLTEQDRFLVCEAMTNASGCTHMTATLATGATAILIDEPEDVDIFLQAIKDYQPTILSIMGKTNYDIINHPSVIAADFQSVRINITGGDKVSKQMLQDFKAKTKVTLRLGYGMSEVLCITVNKSDDPKKLGSIGSATTRVKIRLLDSNKQPVPIGKPGRVWVSGPNVMCGYWNDKPLTQETLQQGWLDTGDLAYQDQDQFFWFHGRAKQLIIREGANISPLEVEEVLAQHPAVKVVAVVGKSDQAEGEVPVAFVILKDNIHVSSQELINFSQERLEDYKVPVAIYVVKSMPLTESNKIDRQKLKEQLERNDKRII